MSMSPFFLVYSAHFNRDKGLDYGRLCLFNENGIVNLWVSTSSIASKQYSEAFHKRGGLIPPAYRLKKGQPKQYHVVTKPLPMQWNPGVAGNFYKIEPFTVITDTGGSRGDFGIHIDGNVPGSLGCIVMSAERFKTFEHEMTVIRKYCDKIPLHVIYS